MAYGQEDLTRKISLNPLRTSRTTFLIWGTSLKILSGRRQRSIISSWAPDLGGMSVGSQHRKIRFTCTTSTVKPWQRVWRETCCCLLPELCLIFLGNISFFMISRGGEVVSTVTSQHTRPLGSRAFLLSDQWTSNKTPLHHLWTGIALCNTAALCAF